MAGFDVLHTIPFVLHTIPFTVYHPIVGSFLPQIDFIGAKKEITYGLSASLSSTTDTRILREGTLHPPRHANNTGDVMFSTTPNHTSAPNWNHLQREERIIMSAGLAFWLYLREMKKGQRGVWVGHSDPYFVSPLFTYPRIFTREYFTREYTRRGASLCTTPLPMNSTPHIFLGEEFTYMLKTSR
jgi:hypothetical protein